ncbi:MAG TPA: hypothetical protein VED45_01230 [Steroidobacteraceae bacterium]|nr:hypothetical protein [Steroidobacteraceae bacterium]
MPGIKGMHLLLATLVAMALWFSRRWWLLERRRDRASGLRPTDVVTGFVTELALLSAATLLLGRNLGWLPAAEGAALGLHGGRLVFAVCVNGLLGALMMLGVGLYAPCLILVTLLGMNPLAAFPIMMGSCALLMPVGGVRFVRAGRYSVGAALGLTLGGIPGVLCAAFIVRSLSIEWLRWLVVVVVIYAALLMLLSAARTPAVADA